MPYGDSGKYIIRMVRVGGEGGAKVSVRERTTVPPAGHVASNAQVRKYVALVTNSTKYDTTTDNMFIACVLPRLGARMVFEYRVSTHQIDDESFHRLSFCLRARSEALNLFKYRRLNIGTYLMEISILSGSQASHPITFNDLGLRRVQSRSR